ncbi:MAG TPA: AraC family transcriptional regulator [Polyangia bacterium]
MARSDHSLRSHPAAREDEAPAPLMVHRSVGGGLDSLLGALDEIRALEDTDLVLRRAVELARDRIGIKRAGIFVLDRNSNLMLGTWGMDLACTVVDEHHVLYDLGGTDLEALRRSEDEGAHFTVFENCPIVEHRTGQSRIAGLGWVAKTPIWATHGSIGMMFNDAALTGDAVDEVKQAYLAILCSLLGTMLDPEPRRLARHAAAPGESLEARLVASILGMLDRDPKMSGKEIAAALDTSLSRVCRIFKTLTGTSLVEYRNQLRLDRFRTLLEGDRPNFCLAAREAGFGSYAQCHRVFRARLRMSPRQYLRPANGDRCFRAHGGPGGRSGTTMVGRGRAPQ